MSDRIINFIGVLFIGILIVFVFFKSSYAANTWNLSSKPKSYIDVYGTNNREHEEKEKIESCKKGLMKKRPGYDNDELNKYYKKPMSEVPKDYKNKEIGECPLSKRQTKNLPIVDVPMCLLTKKF